MFRTKLEQIVQYRERKKIPVKNTRIMYDGGVTNT